MSGWTPGPKNRLEPGETWRSTLFDDLPVPTFHEELYRTAQAAGPSSDAIDAVLDAHRRKHGEPEQVAYAAKLDPCDERFGPPPAQELEKLLEKFGQDAGQRLTNYLREHHAWKQASPSSMRQK